MIVVTLEFPDERVGWVDHLHISFPDNESLVRWLPTLEIFGKIEHQAEARPDGWVCPDCRWKSRPGQRRAARVAIGRDGGFLDV